MVNYLEGFFGFELERTVNVILRSCQTDHRVQHLRFKLAMSLTVQHS